MKRNKKNKSGITPYHKRLFKYVSYDSAKYILGMKTGACGTLKFSRPSVFNDPFEATHISTGRHFFQEIMDSIYVSSPEDLNKQECLEKLKDAVGKLSIEASWTQNNNHLNYNNLIICSFSASSSSPLMWAHYADDHKGVMIEFDICELEYQYQNHRKRKDFKTNPNQSLDPNNLDRLNRLPSIVPVHYSDMRPFANDQYKNDNRELLEMALTTKSLDWAYEQEYRMILTPGSELDAEYECLNLPLCYVKSITFGMRLSHSKKKIIEKYLLNKVLYPNYVELYQAYPDPFQYRVNRRHIKQISG